MGKRDCTHCGGRGWFPLKATNPEDNDAKDCDACNGDGTVQITEWDREPEDYVERVCE